jgi:glycerol-3-phosphate dehydrogenase
MRAEMLDRLSANEFDLLVIGGGITGAGIALDAAARGLSVALVDKGDFASGTSSKSSKLIHGGLRYLEHREFGLMQEACSERDLLRGIAPHLVTPLGFFWPRWAGAGRKARTGLWVYDILAGFRGVGRHRSVSADDAADLLPGARRSEGYMFFDSQTDDSRLVLAILKEARGFGAATSNYCRVDNLLHTQSRVGGAEVVDVIGGTRFQIRAVDVVNATGVWADDIRLFEEAAAGRNLRPSKGMHIVISRSSLPIKTACLLPAPDRRLVFAAPWRSSVIVGTTDTEYNGPLDAPTVTDDEIRYMLKALEITFERQFDISDVEGAYAGLRPLLADPKFETTRDLSRRHAVMEGPQGLITITGGKLTTYRRMAEEVVDLIVRRHGRSVKSSTRTIRLGVVDMKRLRAKVEDEAANLELEQDVAISLIKSYGDAALDVLEIARDEELSAPLTERLPYLEAEVAWSIRSEMAMNVADLLSRRTRISLEDRRAGSGSGRLASLVSSELGTPATEVDEQITQFREELTRERGSALTDSARSLSSAPPAEARTPPA